MDRPILQEYKCPNCAGAIQFDSSIQKMKCPYCDCEFEMEALKQLDADLKTVTADSLNWDDNAGGEWQPGEADGMRVYVCRSCGGEIVGDDTMAASKCPFCDNPIVVMGQVGGDLRPDYVIPFKVSREAAKAALKKHVEGKRLLPKVFKSENHIDEVRGLYVPFWLFDSDADANIRYKATKIRTWSDSNYDYTETSFFNVIRDGSIGFQHVPVDGSSKMPDALMESVEPYDFSGAVDFQTAYLAGYLADRYDVSKEETINRANFRVKKSTEIEFAKTVTGYTSVIPENTGIQLLNGSTKYALYPVWILNTTWNGNKYMFAVNGQTGKIVGDLPLDKSAYRKWLFGLTAAIGAAVFAIGFIISLF